MSTQLQDLFSVAFGTNTKEPGSHIDTTPGKLFVKNCKKRIPVTIRVRRKVPTTGYQCRLPKDPCFWLLPADLQSSCGIDGPYFNLAKTEMSFYYHYEPTCFNRETDDMFDEMGKVAWEMFCRDRLGGRRIWAELVDTNDNLERVIDDLIAYGDTDSLIRFRLSVDDVPEEKWSREQMFKGIENWTGLQGTKQWTAFVPPCVACAILAMQDALKLAQHIEKADEFHRRMVMHRQRVREELETLIKQGASAQ